MDKRYQVFVSSTYRDLLEARQEVMQALLELDCIPAGMELFPAADDDQWTLIKRVIDDCDYYIVIIAGRYGSLGPGNKSFTQLEYEYAIEQGKPVIAFLHKTPGRLPAEDSEKEPEKVKKLEEFRSFAEQKMVRYWNGPADLGSAVSRSLIKLIKNNPGIGWVKADLLPSKESIEEILLLRKQIDTLQRELEASRTTVPKETEHLAQGEDLFDINYGFGAFKSSRYTADTIYSASFEISWSQIFARISPLMIDEATDSDLRSELNRMIREVNMDSLSEDKALEGYELGEFSIKSEDFNTIKIQLLALKLVTKSVKGRSVKDKANYWTLTAYGEAVMTQLRAIRKEGYEKVTSSPSNKAFKKDGA
ncbi:DUF4062 domain-containing protein [Nitrosomonas ureae]|uniref:DUF4062 domain-containing protein n=1 Tax=Nitrosomonas ureae TaxID=44577 RepID=A0A1H2G9U3_9PROT|nr:DUF4062 domain-containing protein [Nitrosomonas ureae]SDU16324.1 protein of unknown function [Nitrosomonas ureae]